MNEYARTLRLLCEAVANFAEVSRKIFFPDEKRRTVLKNFASELKTASENFLKTCEELEHETNRTLQTRR